MSDQAVDRATSAEVGEKGLKKNAIGFISSTVIGVASTAPGYSLAATLGFIVAAGAGGSAVGVQGPAIMILAFVPMLFIAAAYFYMNRADPDCGTTFTWVTKAMGPQLGWINGWVIIVADIVVMANLAQIAGLYTFLLFGWQDAADSTFAVTAVGVVWILIMTWIVARSIELSARTQNFLLSAEVLTLTLFAVVALVKVYTGDPAGSIHPHISWFSPFAIDNFGAMTSGVLLAVFIYWGWDSTVTVNEETKDARRTPGLAALTSTILLVIIYVLVSTAAQAFHGVDFLAENADDVLSALGADVFGTKFNLDKILIIAVLTSAAASTQTTILPTARTSLSMARNKAIPKVFGDVHPRYFTPVVATWTMGLLSVAWYVGLTIVSENILYDSLAALGLFIAFYYGFTGVACAVYYRRELFKSAKNFLYIGVLPSLGGLILFALLGKSFIDLWDPANSESGDSWLGVGPPDAIFLIFMFIGLVLMTVWWSGNREFFKRKLEVAHPEALNDSMPELSNSAATGGE
ncbi:MAG: APC family permease [Actinobacteria bacterium]|nr:APC family permease [Actinomycetota bacterium]